MLMCSLFQDSCMNFVHVSFPQPDLGRIMRWNFHWNRFNEIIKGNDSVPVPTYDVSFCFLCSQRLLVNCYLIHCSTDFVNCCYIAEYILFHISLFFLYYAASPWCQEKTYLLFFLMVVGISCRCSSKKKIVASMKMV